MVARRRVSYVIPPPADPVARLNLPPHGAPHHGSTAPLLLPFNTYDAPDPDAAPRPRHPRHRLGLASLAVDTSTVLSGRAAPEGILYTGGRDGLVISWDLGLPMKRRQEATNGMRRTWGQWETMTGWGDDIIDEEAEEPEFTSDGDVLGEVTPGLSRVRKRMRGDGLPYERQWEVDLEAYAAPPLSPGSPHPQPAQFRQSVQMHADWVNDIILCNYSQTLVSASSDGTIKAWNPHLPNSPEPSTIGSHSDYVRCLAQCREQNWVASGSFDRTIKLWDISRPSQPDLANPLLTLNPPDTNSPKSSVYAIAADPFGHTIASGAPERVVRLWDPRSGKRTGKLVGHTDNIRAILISEDSRYLLTGSADASVKLWSLSSQRCLHTFTYHADSVWSLFSTHPSLEIFYSGDKSGLVCKVDVEDCSDVSEGECVVVCQESADFGMASSEGINKIVAVDDGVLWTATSNSSVKRWRAPPRRSVRAAALIVDGDYVRPESPTQLAPAPIGRRRAHSREVPPSEVSSRPSTGHGPHASLGPSLLSLSSESWMPQRDREDEQTLYGIPFESLVKLTSPNNAFTPYASLKGRDADVATLYSAASVMSVPRAPNLRSPVRSTFRPAHTSPMHSFRTEETAHLAPTARASYAERELAADATPLVSAPDAVVAGDAGLVRSVILNDRVHALTVDTSGEVAVWDIVRAQCRGRFAREDVSAASQSGSTAGGSGRGEDERSPREALEAVRERIEGEAVVVPWSVVDTKTGVLTVHMTERCFDAEVYADEVGFVHDRHFNEESRLNIGKWILRNLFLGFIREEQRLRRIRDTTRDTSQDNAPPPNLRRGTAPHHIYLHNSNMPTKRRMSESSGASRHAQGGSPVFSSPKMIPATTPAVATSTRPSPLLTPMISLVPIAKDVNVLPSIMQSPDRDDVTPMPRRARTEGLDEGQQTATLASAAAAKDGDYFSMRTRGATVPGPASETDDFSGWGGPGAVAKLPDPQVPSTPGGIMGRLKSFSKLTRKPTDVASTPVLGAVPVELPVATEELVVPSVAKTPLQILLAGPFTPPPSVEAPSHALPPNVSILISEEGSPGWHTIYRGMVSTVQQDTAILEEAIPMWLLEYLLLNKTPSIPVTKVSFVLLPYPSADGEPLPELLNATQSKLTASRFLRVRKLTMHVYDKLERLAEPTRSSLDMAPPGQPGQPGSPTPGSPRLRAEALYEVLCNDVVLPLDMTLAAVRQYVWRQAGELTMHYRRRVVADPFQDGSRL